MKPSFHHYNSLSSGELVLEQSSARKLRLKEYWELTKPRLSFLSILTAIVGYLVANPARDVQALITLVIGTALAAGGAASLNQWLEHEVDALMVRTKNRPIPSGQVSPLNAFSYGVLLSMVGCIVVGMGNNWLASALTFSTIFSYVCVYTPLKRVTPWSIQIGAIPGALPPLIGWAAATNELSDLGWILFAILFTWQIPHFMAIAWMYREDYARANMPMLPILDPSGKSTARHSVVYCILLLGISILPCVLKYMTWVYGIAAFVLGLYYLYQTLVFARLKNPNLAARKLFFASILYLPAILLVMVLDRWLLI